MPLMQPHSPPSPYRGGAKSFMDTESAFAISVANLCQWRVVGWLGLGGAQSKLFPPHLHFIQAYLFGDEKRVGSLSGSSSVFETSCLESAAADVKGFSPFIEGLTGGLGASLMEARKVVKGFREQMQFTMSQICSSARSQSFRDFERFA